MATLGEIRSPNFAGRRQACTCPSVISTKENMSTKPSKFTLVERRTAESDIRRLLASYDHNADDGTIDDNAEPLAEARFQVIDAVVVGRDEITRFFNNNIQHRHDAAPRTWRALSNAIIELESVTVANAVSYFTVHQALPSLPFQSIVTGRYWDTFEVVNGAWRFTSRRVPPPLFGAFSCHGTTPVKSHSHGRHR